MDGRQIGQETVEITVNGERRPVAGRTTVLELLRSLDLNPERLAVELNREILKKDRWPETIVRDGDLFEIVHFVGGG